MPDGCVALTAMSDDDGDRSSAVHKRAYQYLIFGCESQSRLFVTRDLHRRFGASRRGGGRGRGFETDEQCVGVATYENLRAGRGAVEEVLRGGPHGLLLGQTAEMT